MFYKLVIIFVIVCLIYLGLRICVLSDDPDLYDEEDEDGKT